MRALLMSVIHLIREQLGSPETNAGTSFQDLHVVLGGEGPNGGMVFIAHAIHLDEVVGKVARNNGQSKLPSLEPTLRKVCGISRGPTTIAPGGAGTFWSP